MKKFTLLAAGCLALNLCASLALAQTSGRTKRPVTKKIHLYIAGDIADCRRQAAAESTAMQTASLVMTQLKTDKQTSIPAYVLTLGDNTYPIGKPEEFSDCYQPTWGQFKEQTLPAPGNHDYGVPKALGYFNYFAEIAGPERRGYYAKQVGPWLLLSLNSNIDGTAMQAQMEWLKQQLAQSKAACTLAFWHHPVFSSGGHGNNEVMAEAWKLLYQAKADLVMAAHDHNYERFAALNAEGGRDDKQGILSFVVGTGGAKLTPMLLPKEHTQVRDNSSYGVLKLVLKDKAYEWEFLGLTGQKFTDTGKGLCH